jgi:hypothetical protein
MVIIMLYSFVVLFFGVMWFYRLKPTFQRNMMSPCSGLKWQDREVEALHRIWRMKAEGREPEWRDIWSWLDFSFPALSLQPWRCTQHVSPKCWHRPIKQHSSKTQDCINKSGIICARCFSCNWIITFEFTGAIFYSLHPCRHFNKHPCFCTYQTSYFTTFEGIQSHNFTLSTYENRAIQFPQITKLLQQHLTIHHWTAACDLLCNTLVITKLSKQCQWKLNTSSN